MSQPIGTLLLVLALAAPWPAAASAWHMRPAQSAITVTASQQGANFTGAFKKFETKIDFDPSDLAHASVIATIDMASFDSSSADRDSQVQGADWFDVTKFPTARFATRSFRDLGGGKYEANADLTLRGVTKPVVLPFTLAIAGNVAHMSGSLTIKRADYGIGQGEWASTDWVGQDVKVDINLVADRAP